MHEKRSVRVALGQDVERSVDGPVHGVVAFLQMPRPGPPPVGIHTVTEPFGRWAGMEVKPLLVVPTRRFVPASGQDHPVKTVALALRIDVAAPYVETVVALIGQNLRQCVRLAPTAGLIADLTAIVALLTAQDHPLGACCGRYLRVSIGEIRAVVDHIVDIGRLHDGVPRQAQVIAAVGIGEIDDDVGAIFSHCRAPSQSAYIWCAHS